MTSCRFSRWQRLDFRDPKMGSLKSPSTTSYMSSVETIAPDCLVFFLENRVFLHFGDRQTNRWTSGPSHEAAVAVASGGLINTPFYIEIGQPRLQKSCLQTDRADDKGVCSNQRACVFVVYYCKQGTYRVSDAWLIGQSTALVCLCRR